MMETRLLTRLEKKKAQLDALRPPPAAAVQKWVGLNPDRLRYEMIFTPSDSVVFNQLAPARQFISEGT